RHCLSVFSWWCAASRPLRSFPTRRSSDLLSELVRRRKIDRVLLALPSASRRRRREILTQLEPLGVHVQSLPNLSDLISGKAQIRSEEHTSELQSLRQLVCRLLLEKKNEVH